MALSVINVGNYCVFAAMVLLIARRNVNMSAGARTCLHVLVAFALAGCTVALIRLQFVRFMYFGSDEYVRLGNMWILSIWETAIGIVIICLATMRPLLMMWKDAISRRIAHLRGREYHKDHTGPTRVVQRRTMVPTTSYYNMVVDVGTMKRIGVLPDCEEDDEDPPPARPRPVHITTSSMRMASINELMFMDIEPVRKLSTV